VVAMVFYLVLSLLCSMYFGAEAKILVTLNWKTYTGNYCHLFLTSSGWDGGWGMFKMENSDKFAAGIRMIIMAMPAFDMLSVYPLIAITLGNNFRDSLASKVKKKVASSTVKGICRIGAALPPFVFAMMISDVHR
jgi:hypothetical protein